jgi:hypothetical protein
LAVSSEPWHHRKSLADIWTDFVIVRDTTEEGKVCNILAPELCQIVNADPYTLVLCIWAALQLTWVTMLMFVQLVQISRAMTTWENMSGTGHAHGHGSKASMAITSALTTGTTSRSGAQIGDSNMGPDPALPPTHAPGHHHKEGCFKQWKKILGVDTFVETATGKTNRRNRNPFSNGCIGNCKDFWCDPAPVFGKRENGTAMLRGQVVDYTAMYETPRLMTIRSRGGAAYESLGTDDSV